MGTVLAVLGVLAVLLVAGVVATRDGAVLRDAPPDGPDAVPGTDGPLRAADLERVRFPMALRGYRMAEVDALLDRLAAELRDREAQGPPAGPAVTDAAAGPPPQG